MLISKDLPLRIAAILTVYHIMIQSMANDRELSRSDQMARKLTRRLAPMHPGEVLREEFLIPLQMSAGALAKACGVPRTRIERLANEETGVTADTALRLAKAFETTTALWLNLQNDYDVQMAEREIGKDLAKIEPVVGRAA
jgi:addiction module HigA family antidote